MDVPAHWLHVELRFFVQFPAIDRIAVLLRVKHLQFVCQELIVVFRVFASVTFALLGVSLETGL